MKSLHLWVFSLTYLFICSLFNDAARNPDSVLLNDLMVVSEE